MPSYRRILVRGGTYFFTVNLENRKSKILTEHFQLLSSVIAEVKKEQPFCIRGWVVLPDHIHCILSLPEHDHDYSSRWRQIKTLFSWRYKIREKCPSQRIWQNRFWEHTIRHEADFINHLNYIHFNPVKHGHVNDVAKWRFSSFHHYASKGLELPGSGADTGMIEMVDVGER